MPLVDLTFFLILETRDDLQRSRLAAVEVKQSGLDMHLRGRYL